jgi:hypothetical protein
MMRIREAEQKLRSVSHPDAWMRRVRNEQGRYVYEAGIGVKTFASECFSPEQCYAMASLNYDQFCHEPED